jgi:DGQHR domain-containing protein
MDSLTMPAIKLTQNGRTLYLFGIDGKKLADVAAVSHLERDDAGKLLGYQRPEIANHIAQIRQYLETSKAMLPNAIIMALDKKRVAWEPVNKKNDDVGHLTMMLSDRSNARKPAYIVDGQQRAAALRDATTESFPVCAVGFVADNEQEEREQFVLVNSGKPLPKSLLYELLPEFGTDSSLSNTILKRRIPALLVQRLANDDDSPLRGLIKTPSNPEGVATDGHFMLAMDRVMDPGGALSDFKSDEEPYFDVDGALGLLKAFWKAVKTTFPEAWGKSSRESRLLHGAGVQALSQLLNDIAARHREHGKPTQKAMVEELTTLAPLCHWTEGSWKLGAGGTRPWNHLASTPKDVAYLAEFLRGQYKKLVWKASAKAG